MALAKRTGSVSSDTGEVLRQHGGLQNRKTEFNSPPRCQLLGRRVKTSMPDVLSNARGEGAADCVASGWEGL